MDIQEVLGLPLKVGLDIVGIESDKVIIKETFSKNKSNEFLNNDLKDPYILRIREVNNSGVEILISYF